MQGAQKAAESASHAQGELLAKLQAAHAETELFLRSIPSILIGVDFQGRITRWNLTATNTFGIDDHMVEGRTIEDCGIRWLHPEMKAEITRWLATESSYRCDNLAYEREGKTRFLGLHVLRISAKGRELWLSMTCSARAFRRKRQQTNCLPFGMVLDEELRTKAGILLVAKGQEVTAALILRLKSFQEYGNIGRTVKVSSSVTQAPGPHAMATAA